MGSEAARERQIPLGLIVAGLVLFATAAVFRAGPGGAALAMGAMGIVAVIGVALMVLAAFVTSAITSTSFGDFGAAVLKFAGIYLFSSGVSAILGGGWLGGLVGTAVFFSLIVYLFELETPYAVAFTLIYWVVSFMAALAVTGAARG